MNSTEIFLLEDNQQIDACFEVFLALRPHLSREAFLAQVLRQQAQGYRILALRENGMVCSAAGFRLCEFLAWGRVLYIDDLSTLPELRGKGHAGQLLDWLIAHAEQQHCAAVHLDTGYGRHDAHRLYLNKGFLLSSHHMSKSLAGI
jgi:GNAT superfamily N-acetyltransferase